ncbi:fatty acyl-CoA reductase wat-like isoform X2 [Macrosteles quadrilineatus]|nr:fatty acyl-CoA reductase wat-like isoform X2 [Macrosteles quadrilineatus]
MSQSVDVLLEESPIQEFYRDQRILITGGTGFLGKVLVEKLLRSCPQVGQILLLIRSKKDADCQERLDAMMEDAILKGVSPKNKLKVVAVSGDCTLPGLGLSEIDRQTLISNVTVVFHVAATVRFDEELSSAISINVRGTKAILDLAREMPNLKSMVHVSTAYSQCHLQQIEEKFYPSAYNPEKLMRLAECVDKPYLDQLTPLLLKESPNTYVYTKAVAEEVVRTNSKGLPVSIFRPSIVVATKNEPFPGWIDNLYGPTGVVVATVTGIMRTLHADPDKVADMVPADMVVNGLIATAWKTHLRSNTIESAEEAPQIFNFVSSPENPIKWSDVFTLGMRFLLEDPKSILLCRYRLPTVHAVWHPNLTLNRNYFMHRVQHFLYHVVPAVLVDTAASLVGKRTNLLKITRKVDRFGELISYFAMRQWTFSNSNVQDMWGALSAKDQETFPFSFQGHDWTEYFKIYMRGTRLYLLKDDLSTMSRAETRTNRFFWLHQTLKAVLLYLFAKLMWNAAGARLVKFIYSLIVRAPGLPGLPLR